MILPLVALDDISFRFQQHEILRGVTCEIQRGGHLAIVGANGSGKSSLLRIISGELWPERGCGNRRFALHDASETTSPLLARPHIRRIAPEMQERYLRLGLPLTVFEFVASGITDRDYAPMPLQPGETAQVEAMLDLLHLRRFAGQEARTLSHGTLRRAFVARALVAVPALLALDEVTDGLDSSSCELVLALLDRAVEGGTTLVCVAHRIERLPACIQQFYELRGGKLSAIVRPAPPVYQSPRRTALSAKNIAGKPGQAIVELAQVYVSIDEHPVLSDINFTLRSGEHVAITGENGAGKSTLAAVIDGTYLASSGILTRHGYRARPSLREIRRRIVTLSDALQVRHDWLCTVRDTIAAGFFFTIGPVNELDGLQQKRVAELLERFHLQELADRLLPELSFGQRRRALLARAFVNEPEILILDEIFDGLDLATRAMLERELERATQGNTTLICISHAAADIPAYITRRVTLDGGRIIVATSPA